MDLKEEYDATFYYAATKKVSNQGIHGTTYGFALIDHLGYGLTDYCETHYPDLVLSRELDAKNIKQRYQSQMKLLSNHSDFTSLFSDYELGVGYQEIYAQSLEDINIYGVLISVSKQELLNMLEELDISFVKINDVRLTKYS